MICRICNCQFKAITNSHHWNYDKKETNPFYFVSVSRKIHGEIHGETNHDKNYWINYFRTIAKKRWLS